MSTAAAVCPFTFSPVWNIATDLKESITCEVSKSILPIVSGMWGGFQSTANPIPENLTNCVSPLHSVPYRTKLTIITIFTFSILNVWSDEWGDICVCKYIHKIKYRLVYFFGLFKTFLRGSFYIYIVNENILVLFLMDLRKKLF